MLEREINASRKTFIKNRLIGIILLFTSGLWNIFWLYGVYDSLFGEEGRDVEGAIILFVLVAWGTIWFLLGIRIFVKLNQFRKYAFIIGTSSENVIENICNSTGHSKRKVEKNMAYMIKKQYFIPKSSKKKEETLMEFFGIKDEEDENVDGEAKKEITIDDIDILYLYENESRKTLRILISEMLILIGGMIGGVFPGIELIASFKEQNGSLTSIKILLCAGAFVIGTLLLIFGIIRLRYCIRYSKYMKVLLKYPEGYFKDIAKELEEDESIVIENYKAYFKKGFFYNARFDEDEERIVVRFMAAKSKTNTLGIMSWEKVADMTVERCPYCGNLNYILIGITKRCSECGERL